MKMTMISVAQAIEDGNWKWNKDENDIEYMGFIPGYTVGVCMEVKKPDGSIGYSSCTFIDREELYTEMPELAKCYDSLHPLALTASLCSYASDSVPTGRLVFRGYFNSEYDYDEREEVFTDASQEVLNLREKYNVEEV